MYEGENRQHITENGKNVVKNRQLKMRFFREFVYWS